MANLFFALAVPAADGTGAWTDVIDAGNKKTFTVQGAFVGTITIEVSNDAGTGFHPVASFTNAGDKTMDIPCNYMRVRRVGTVSGTPTVTVASEDDGTRIANLPVSAGDGVGAAVDVGDYGNMMSILVAAAFTGTVTIEISEDGTTWSQVKSFTAGGYVVMEFIANYMRVRRSGNSGGTPNVDVAAGNDADSLLNIFGDGSDGDVTLGGDATLTRDMYYRSLDMAGFDIFTAGYRIFVQESLLIPALSVIDRSGNHGVAEAAGAALAVAMLGNSGAGGAGATAAGAAGGAIAQCIGGAGGAAGLGTGGAAGAGGAATAPTATEPYPRSLPMMLLGQYFTPGAAPDVLKGGCGGGGGGGDGAADEGGGGGSGGGVVLVAANRIDIVSSGGITARGGPGAAGTAADCGGGGGGGGGAVILVYRTLQNAGLISAAGGGFGASGGGGGAVGVVGSNGTVFSNKV